MNTRLLAIQNLSFAYKDFTVFESFSFSADSRTTVLEGPPGCGKTTLLKLLAGELTATNTNSVPSNDHAVLILQDESLFPWLTGIDNITQIVGISQADVRRHPMYELVEPFVARLAFQMSHGQRRLVELFRAVLFRPAYLYLDEPFNFLDARHVSALIPFLGGAHMDDVTLTIATHHHAQNLGHESVCYRFPGTFPVRTLDRGGEHAG